MSVKRLIMVILCAALLVTGCLGVPKNKEDREKAPLSPERTTYIGYSDASDHGYAMAVVTIEGDRITDVTLKEFMELFVEKSFSTESSINSLKVTGLPT